ncbi:MAG TPA: peptide-methionine (R)-S-oxide reductase MsrB [Chthonomonadales bacterium]|nr:peptide-methionine (R)-S-oxide reductase MsrB [Chthonomonadales bacterium]
MDLRVLAAVWAFGASGYGDQLVRSARAELASRQEGLAMVRQGSAQRVVRTEEEWKRLLTPEQYEVLRRKGTERAFTGQYWSHKEEGIYECAGCGAELFRSDTKFDSGCGWPSFWQSVDRSRIAYADDFSHGMHRIEVTCARCGGHLGHVFDDGPQPTGQRYCINSASLGFRRRTDAPR